jgi:hypothetical protein
LFVLDNPTSAACQAKNVNFGNTYTVIYRISMSPGTVADALSIHGTLGDALMISTQGPNLSLQGAASTTWNYISKYAGSGSLATSSSNLTLKAGLTGLPAAPGNANIILNGSINDFDAESGCNGASVLAAMARDPF